MSGRRRHRTSAPSSWPRPPTKPGRPGSSPTALRRAITRCAWPWPSPVSTCWCSATRTPAWSTDSCSAAGWRASWPPNTTIELGMAHGVTPEALREALERSPDITAAFIVSPTYYGMAADIRGCAEVAHAAGAALVVDCAWGSHFGFHPRLPESPLRQGADAVAGLDPQDRRQPHPVGHAACRPRRPRRSRGGGALRAAGALHEPELAAARFAGQRPAPARRPRRGAAGPRRWPPRPGPGTRSTRSPGARWSARRWSGGPGSRAGIRCGS